ncbi:hypothetical protein SDC9_64779 [bioreactor metagenome]|uniref:Uncharacterized protein n=1 Tax=bioreactor metagenome TaxID=1076179 RepID=A0A644XQ78_9ZZZZ
MTTSTHTKTKTSARTGTSARARRTGTDRPARPRQHRLLPVTVRGCRHGAGHGGSLPLDGARRLARHVEDHPIDLAHLVGDPGGDLLQQVVRQPAPVGGHGVLAGHRAQHDRVSVRTPVTLHADRAHIGQQDDRELPDVTVQPGGLDLLAGDRVGSAQQCQPLLVDRTDDPDRQARTGERVAPDHLLGQPQLGADRPDLVLEQGTERLDELELQVVGQPPDIVVGLDVGRTVTTTGLHHVRVERALGEELDRFVLVQLTGGRLERADELPADDLALGLGIGHPGELPQEDVGDLLHHQVHPGRGDEVLLDLLRLALAQQPVVHEHTDELVTDRPAQQGGRDGRVDSAGQAAEHALVADDLPDPGDRVLHDVRRGPVGTAAGDVIEEVLEDALAVLGVHHLGVPLHPGDPASQVLERCDRRPGRVGQGGETGGDGLYRVAVAHPGTEIGGQAAQQRAGLGECGRRPPELRQAGAGHVAAEGGGDRLEPVADAEDRDAGVEQCRIHLRGTLGVHRLGAAGQDDRLGVAGGDLGGGGRVRHDLGEDPGLTDAACDELGILRTEVDDDDGVVGLRPRGAARCLICHVPQSRASPPRHSPCPGTAHHV